MSVRKNLFVLLIGGFLLSGVSAVYAQMPELNSSQEKGFREKIEDRMQELYKDLNLTPEQKVQLEENKGKNRGQMKGLFQSMKLKREALAQELQQESLNMGKITQLNNELKVLQAQMLDDRLAGILEVRKILTPDQFKQFMARMDERKEHKRRRGDAKTGMNSRKQ